jgi:hypothetical protein
MLSTSMQTGGALPRWQVVGGSGAILLHLAAILVPILDVRSGPWPASDGRDLADPPQFAHAAAGLATVHAKYLRVAHSYHFVTNRPSDLPGVEFEVRLKDGDGKPLQTLKFPDPQANAWVRHRQQLLAHSLAPDLPVAPPGGEVIAAPGQKMPAVTLWMMPDEGIPGSPAKTLAALMTPDRAAPLRVQTVPQHLVPRNRPVMRPSDWALVLERSYARYLCRLHGAASAEVIRHTREPIPPTPLFGSNTPRQALEDLVASFEEVQP